MSGSDTYYTATCNMVAMEGDRIMFQPTVTCQRMEDYHPERRQARMHVLFVADNSGSMCYHMQSVNTGLANAITACMQHGVHPNLCNFNEVIDEHHLPYNQGAAAVASTIQNLESTGGTDFDIVVDRLVAEMNMLLGVARAQQDRQHRVFLVVMTDGQASMPSEDKFAHLQRLIEEFTALSVHSNEVNVLALGVGGDHQGEFLDRLSKVVPNSNRFFQCAAGETTDELTNSITDAMGHLTTSLAASATTSSLRVCIQPAGTSTPVAHVQLRETESESVGTAVAVTYQADCVQALPDNVAAAVFAALRQDPSRSGMFLGSTTATPLPCTFTFVDLEDLEGVDRYEAESGLAREQTSTFADNLPSQIDVRRDREVVETGQTLLGIISELIQQARSFTDLPDDDQEFVGKTQQQQEQCHSLLNEIVNTGRSGPDVITQLRTHTNPLVAPIRRRRVQGKATGEVLMLRATCQQLQVALMLALCLNIFFGISLVFK
ncbi:hypothetical protein PTSG_09900 [Salpingoeca rosetta]|uniref:VWFA domain-containing protein n=1 Tax=Salpingoeca rosetta (strain ATCC 50818 / BSB-021) TaxID=946362 RepID=F2UNG4_SALR5|nr:uncharacterized protein PTSG_09900 [Salpingoeca rosetta]EGD79169.1 hypothetical protein PTSG_09900 [Salpingoeca rosetta]|eukprot:XP_004989254.1 hypothetical protein PTSG_09900 [Salpingoeca rosetta]